MTKLRFLFVALLLVAGPTLAQTPSSPDEISFWETVRDSKNPTELQAYIDQYPNGRFVVLAKARLAALQKPAASPAPARSTPAATPPAPAVASFAPSSVTSETRMPQAGDSWSYRLSYPRLRGQWGQAVRPPSTHVIKVGQVGGGKIIDQLAIDGGTPSEATQSNGAYLTLQGASIFSPYLLAFREAPVGRLGDVESRDAGCGKNYRCDATARVVGRDTVSVPAGRFQTTKIVIEQQWAAFSAFSSLGSSAADMTGGRRLTVWYSPELKRAVKYESRLLAGAIPPMDANFDLELVSYQVK